jgi:AcrR family transcriptional regulator
MTLQTKREQRHAQTKQDILNTAFDLIITKGADKLSLREIARNVGYKSPAGLYEYFDGKDDIIDAVCTEADGRFLSYMQYVEVSLSARDYIIELGMAYIRFARENPQAFMFLFDNHMVEVSEDELHEAILSNTDNTFGVAYHAIQRCIDEGIINPADDMTTLDITYCFWALLHGCSMLQIRYLKSFPMNFESVDRQAVTTLLNGFGIS